MMDAANDEFGFFSFSFKFTFNFTFRCSFRFADLVRQISRLISIRNYYRMPFEEIGRLQVESTGETF